MEKRNKGEKLDEGIKKMERTNKRMHAVFNPFLPSWEYIPDGEPHIYGGRLYLFGSHDRFNGNQFCMNDYVCWSCPLEDLSNWRKEGIIYRKLQDPAAKADSIMQAPDVCQGPDGRFYLYYTLGLIPYMSVAVCDTPAGQYEYYGVVKYQDGTPVGLREHDVFQFDPGVFVDDDGRIWLYSGFGPKAEGVFASACQKFCMEGAYAMELQPDMLTVKDGPKMVFSKEGEHGFFEASSMRKIDGRYYFIYSSQLGHELCWAVGDKPDGTFQYGGTLVSNGDVGLSEKPRNYTGNTHGSLVKVGDQWYVFYHRQTNRHQYSRQACAEKILFKEGRFCQVEMTSCGLNDCPLPGHGEYEARIACNLWSKDGALFYGVSGTPDAKMHPFFTQSGEDRESSGDQYIANMCDGSVAGFKYFEFDGISEIGVLASCTGSGEFMVMTDLDREPVCQIPVSATGEAKWFSACASTLLGTHALYFRFQGTGRVNFYKICLS